MEAAAPPFGDGFAAVHGGLPAHFEPLHEGFEEAEVDGVVFDYEDVDGWDGAVEETGGRGGLGRHAFLGVAFCFGGTWGGESRWWGGNSLRDGWDWRCRERRGGRSGGVVDVAVLYFV